MRPPQVGPATARRAFFAPDRDGLNPFLCLVVGASTGWAFSFLWAMRTDSPQRVVLNMCVGTVGAMVGGWLRTWYLGPAAATPGHLTWSEMLAALAHALVFLAALNVARQRKDA